MDFWVDIAFAVLLRLLKDRRERGKWESALKKVHDAIEVAFPHMASGATDVGSVEGD